MSVYLDNNASAPMRPEALAAMTAVLAEVGNPSSIHAAGRKARARVETARAQVAGLVGADPQDIVFTGSGTEANALGIHSAIAAGHQWLIFTASEHPSVRQTVGAASARGARRIEDLGVDQQGLVSVEEIARTLQAGEARGDGHALVVVQAANSETGVIQAIPAIAEVCRRFGAWLHVDMVQAAGKLPLETFGRHGDTWTLSAHKIGGPQGVGALIAMSGRTLTPDVRGGGQERGARAGTENVAGIVGFGEAARLAGEQRDRLARQKPWRDAAAARLQAEGAEVVGAHTAVLDNTLCAAIEDWPSQMQVMALDLAGVMVSAGSACASGKATQSPVLTAMGLDRLAAGAVRASGGWATTEADWVRFADAWVSAYAAYRAHRQERAA